MILLISGSSGSGKNTIIKEIIKNNGSMKYIQTFSSREKRPGESEGNPFFFISKEEFQNKIRNKDFVEHELIHGNFYGIDKHYLQKLLDEGCNIVKDMGVMGTFNVKEYFGDEYVETIYLDVSKKALKKRLELRGDKKTDIKIRLSRYKLEESYMHKYNYIIENNNLNDTLYLINRVIKYKSKNFWDYIYLTKQVDKINIKKVNKYCNQFINNKVFKPVTVYCCKGKFYINNDIEKYLASVITGKNLAKKLILKDIKLNTIEKPENVVNFINEYKNM